ncbi:MAG: ROK family protein [Sphingobacteriaceae bacterium]|nr:ROK family protein [Sphingobacteriaceae bacterium]
MHIGVDLGGTNVRAGLVQKNNIIKVFSSKIESNGEENIVVNQVINAIQQVITAEVESIGVGVPGILNTQTGVIYDVQNIPSWKAVPLKDILENHFKIPVFINNDANCFACGEWYFTEESTTENNLTGLILGTGVAAGLICDGKLYEGRNCGAGEFGMIPYLDHNYEFYCSGNYFKHFHNTDGEILYNLAKSNDKNALAIFEQFGIHVSALIKTILFAVDPQTIVIGGSVSKAFPFFESILWSSLQDFPYKPVIENIKIKASKYENIAILGAAALHAQKNS